MVADDGGALRREIDAWRAAFEAQLERCPDKVWRYAMAATSALNAGKIRISPRRARLLARSLLAATIVAGGVRVRCHRCGRRDPLDRWRRWTLDLLREHLLPDPRSRARREAPHACRIPVLSPGDRRAFLRAQWSPFLPEASWQGALPRREGTAHVYLDVSGSMSAEMPLVIALLARLSNWIHRPFWAFSDVVAPAVIEQGQLKARTTGGTSMACVLAHVAKIRPAAAIVVTDGYVERLDRAAVHRALNGTRLTALVTRNGNAAELQRVGIPYRQLDKVPS